MVQVVSRRGDGVTIEVPVRLSSCLPETEVSSLQALARLDADGSPIQVGKTIRSVRARQVNLPEPICQGADRALRPHLARPAVFTAPLEHKARIIRGDTPRFASYLCHKPAQIGFLSRWRVLIACRCRGPLRWM